MNMMLKDKTVLVIGGTGSWGNGLVKELLKEQVSKVRIFSRNEYRMVKMLQKFQNTCVEGIIGDVRDCRALKKAMEGCDTVFDLAALKHVPICEMMPTEAIETNVIGTQNIIQCALEMNLKKVVYVSTDKAVNANCTYGCTKLLGEKLILSANLEQQNTKFMIFRGGNLLGSAGSVLPIFQNQITETGAITLTDEGMTRFFITIERASQLLIEVACKGAGGEIFIPVMPSVSIKHIAQCLLQKKGLNPENIKHIGIRPGEKLHEQMVSEGELEYLYQFNKDLVFIDRKDTHGWSANAFVTRAADYNRCSSQNILGCEETLAFLEAANI